MSVPTPPLWYAFHDLGGVRGGGRGPARARPTGNPSIPRSPTGPTPATWCSWSCSAASPLFFGRLLGAFAFIFLQDTVMSVFPPTGGSDLRRGAGVSS